MADAGAGAGPSKKLAPEHAAKFRELQALPYAKQAQWFLNACWNDKEPNFGENAEEREGVWARVQKFISLDLDGKEGSALDEFKSHQLLEAFGETLTVREMRAKMREVDLDLDGKASALEIFIFKYDKDVARIVMPQADPKEVKAAGEKVAAAQAAVAEVVAKLDQETKALEEVRASEEESKRALAELKKEEDEFNNKVADLEGKSQDQNLGVVKRNRAAAELAQLKAEDPMPLRRAKITQEAALRRLEKARKALEKAKAATEKAKEEAEAAFKAAVEYLEDVKSRVGSSEGSIWWMERELEEAKKYMPQKKR